jgi:transcriptional regulator with XRE-family HTH domain
MNKTAFAYRLRAILKENEMTQKTLGDKAGIEKAHLSHIMSGDRAPSMGTLSKILQALPAGTDCFYLVTGEKRKEKR